MSNELKYNSATVKQEECTVQNSKEHKTEWVEMIKKPGFLIGKQLKITEGMTVSLYINDF